MNPLQRRLVATTVAAVSAAALISTTPGPVAASDISWTRSAGLLGTKVVFVEDRVPARFDSALRSAVAFVDRYTGSDMRIGKCRKGYRCIRVVVSKATNGHGAWTSWTKAREVSEIRLSPALARKGWYTRRSIIDHELGHANGAEHNAKCTSRMWANYTCRNKRLPPRTFTTAERAKLARW